MSERVPEGLAAELFTTAIAEGKAAELLQCLWEDGTAAVDAKGRLVLIPKLALDAMVRLCE